MVKSDCSESLFSFQDPEDFGLFQNVLRKAGFNDAGVLTELGIEEPVSVKDNDVPLLLSRTKQDKPLDTLIRLFLMEVPVEIDFLRRAIEPMTPEKLLDAGLIQVNGTAVTASLRLLPYQDLFMAFDSPRRLQSSSAHDYVMGIGSSSLTLANLTVRKHSGSTLDIGTGCGIQALLAARHSDRVIAVDRNVRAIKLAGFNARLNGLSNIDFMEGDLFEPVQGYSFDLIVTNPPFVISPEMRYIYRDSGMEGDSVCRKIVREAPLFLNEGGYCQILCNWIEHPDENWENRLRGWFENTGCDGWIIRTESRKAEIYASTWIRHTERDSSEQYAKRFNQWMAYYDSHDIEAISAGLITMRRSNSHKNWFRAEDGPKKMMGPCGDDIARGFELYDFLETMKDDSMLLDNKLHISPDLQLKCLYETSREGWREVSSELKKTRGFPYSGNIDSYVANLLVKCDGKRNLKALFLDMAASLETDPDKIVKPFCKIIRDLIARGFLLPPNLRNLEKSEHLQRRSACYE